MRGLEHIPRHPPTSQSSLTAIANEGSGPASTGFSTYNVHGIWKAPQVYFIHRLLQVIQLQLVLHCNVIVIGKGKGNNDTRHGKTITTTSSVDLLPISLIWSSLEKSLTQIWKKSRCFSSKMRPDNEPCKVTNKHSQ